MKLTLTSNKDQPVIRVEDGQAYNFKGRDMYATIDFTAEDLRQLNAFAATCPMFGEAPCKQCVRCTGYGRIDSYQCGDCRATGAAK